MHTGDIGDYEVSYVGQLLLFAEPKINEKSPCMLDSFTRVPHLPCPSPAFPCPSLPPPFLYNGVQGKTLEIF